MLAERMGRFILPLVLLVLPHETQCMDGCPETLDWRCNEVCINRDKDCNCGNETFYLYDHKWCCILQQRRPEPQ